MGKITINLLTTRNAIPTVNDILLDRNANQYFIVAGEENATTFQISFDSSAFEGYDFYVEMVNASGFGIQKTKLENNSTTDWVISDTEFYLPVGMAVAGYGYISITAEKNSEKIVFMPVKVKVQNTIPDWQQGISEGSSVYLDNGYLYYRSKDGTVTNLGYVQGSDGEDGNGILSVAKTATVGLVDTYTIIFTNGTSTTFNVTNGADGEDGKGISSVAKTSTSGLVDTYTITFTDGSSTTFNVTNGADGADGLGVPAGGTTGQILRKVSGTDNDTEWSDEKCGCGVDILVNSDFSINQRGKGTGYGNYYESSTSEDVYTVDHWFIPKQPSNDCSVRIAIPHAGFFATTPYLKLTPIAGEGYDSREVVLLRQDVETKFEIARTVRIVPVTFTVHFGTIPRGMTVCISIYYDNASSGGWINKTINGSQSNYTASITADLFFRSTKICVKISVLNVPENQVNEISISQMKLEAGTAFTGFSPKVISEEMPKCLRYYRRIKKFDEDSSAFKISLGRIISSTEAEFYIPCSIPMKSKPIIDYSDLSVSDGVTSENVTGIVLDQSNNDQFRIIATCQNASFQTGNFAELETVTQSGYLAFDAEDYTV